MGSESAAEFRLWVEAPSGPTPYMPAGCFFRVVRAADLDELLRSIEIAALDRPNKEVNHVRNRPHPA